MASGKTKIKVAVIGAGAAGLCAGRHLIAEPEKFEFDIFEQQDEVGGTWRFSPHVGVDDYGLPVHSSIYKNLRTNLPKEAMAYPDFPFEDCGGKSFIHHTQVLKYLQDYAKHYGLYEHIKFRKFIEGVRPVDPSGEEVGGEWSVSFSDVLTRDAETRLYDAVMVCNGRFSVPYFPEVRGLSDFDGVVIHSHDYREPRPFEDLKVVVVGAGPSGIDIALEVASVAKEVVLSHNKPPYSLPDRTRQQKGVESVGKSSVTFPDGERCNCDAMIVCTGYLCHYPFLHPSCGLEIGDQRVSPLYLHMFLVDFPTLAIWGIPTIITPFPLYDQQAKVFLKYLKGDIRLPSKEAMRAETERDFQHRLELGMKPRHAHVMRGELLWEYDDALSRIGEIDPISDAVRNLFRHVYQRRKMDMVNYQDANFNLVDDKTFVEVE